jgi:hypothetical protein
MDNNELKIRSTDVSRRIELGRQKGEDVSPLLREKIELLKIGYEKLSNQLRDDQFEKNPKKYSTLLAFQNNIKKIQEELNVPTSETDKEINNIHKMMEKAGLAWLLQAGN